MTADAPFWTDDPALAARTLKRWRSGALRVLTAEVAPLMMPIGPRVMPIVTVQPRADVVDLVRRHDPALDGPGDVCYDWRFVLDPFRPRESKALVQCTFVNPARCLFALEFAILDSLPFLHLACTRNTMLLRSGRTTQHGIHLNGVAVPELHSVVGAAQLIVEAGVA